MSDRTQPTILRACRNCRYYSDDERCMNAETKRDVQAATGVLHVYEGMRQIPSGTCGRFEAHRG